MSRAHAFKSQTARNILVGVAALVFALGIGSAAIIYANNQKLDIEALKLVIEQMPELKVAKIPPLTLEQPEPLKLEQGTVGVTRTTTAEKPVQPQIPSQPQKTADGDAIKTEVTVFNVVSFGAGEIDTGWRYASGNSKSPTSQYCYYTYTRPDGSQQKVDIALDRVPQASARKLVPRFDVALSKCVWFGAK